MAGRERERKRERERVREGMTCKNGPDRKKTQAVYGTFSTLESVF